jgi:hypothetical protein
MTKILYFAEGRGGRGATVKLPSGEPCLLSIAQSSVLVKKSRFGILGPVLYREPDIYKSASTAMALTYLLRDDRTPGGISDPVLKAYFNALLHSSSAAELCLLLNEAVARAERQAGCPLREIPRNAFPAWAFT